MFGVHLQAAKAIFCICQGGSRNQPSDATKGSDNSEISGSNTSSLIFVSLAFYPLSKM